MKQNTVFLILWASILFYPLWAYQPEAEEILFQISKPTVNPYNGYLTIEMVAKRRGQPVDISVDNLFFYDHKNDGKRELEIDHIQELKPEEKDALTVLFLIDISGSMKTGNKFEGAKAAVLNTVLESDLPEGTKYFVATFHDHISENIPITTGNVREAINGIATTGNDTDLYTAIMTKVRELSELDGKKALILLSDGEHDIRRNPKYQNGAPKPTLSGVYEALTDLDYQVMVLPVGLGSGADEVFLTSIPDSTVNSMDLYSYSSTPEKLDSIFTRLISGLSGNYRITLKNNALPYIGDERTLEAIWTENISGNDTIHLATSTQFYSEGRINFSIPSIVRESELIKLFLIGLGVIILLFVVLSLIIPILKKREFRRRYVVPHKQKGNLVTYDTVSNEPIHDGDLVVTKCQQLIPLHVWEGVGEKCPHFPECIHSMGCDGAGAQEVSADFFSQKGELKKINWLWFGAVGGFLAWIMYAIYRGRFIDFEWHHSLVGSILSSLHLADIDSNNVCTNCAEIANDTYVGICVGTGLALTLALSDQLGKLHKFTLVRILFKTMLGAIIGGVAFLMGSLLNPGVISSSLLTGLLAWSLFGFLFGLVLAIGSSIAVKRSVMASLLASVLSYFIYYFAFLQGGENIEIMRLFSLIILGGMIGFVIVTVVTTLENYELELVAPDEYRGYIIPISKWLQQGMVVSVGKAPKNQVYVKWIDECVEDKHAEFTKDQDHVYLQPIGEILVNDRLIARNKRTALKNLDIIQLGRDSRTKLRYLEKRSTESDQIPLPAPRSASKGKGEG